MALPFPPNLLKTGVGPSVVQSCHSLSLLFRGKKGKICISVINGPSLPPKPSQTPSNLSQVLLTKVAMARMRECQSI